MCEVPGRGSAVGCRCWTGRGRPGAVGWGGHSCPVARRVQSLFVTSLLGRLGGPRHFPGPRFIHRRKWVLVLTYPVGGKVSGGVRRAHSQALARKGAVGGTAPPRGGSPCPTRPGVQGTTCSPSRPFPAQQRRVSDPSRRCLWKVVYETHSSSDNTGDTRMSPAEPGVLANLGHRRE